MSFFVAAFAHSEITNGDTKSKDGWCHKVGNTVIIREKQMYKEESEVKITWKFETLLGKEKKPIRSKTLSLNHTN